MLRLAGTMFFCWSRAISVRVLQAEAPNWCTAVCGTYFDCNLLQVVENHRDQSHVFILHQDTAQRGVEGINETADGLLHVLLFSRIHGIEAKIYQRAQQTGTRRRAPRL